MSTLIHKAITRDELQRLLDIRLRATNFSEVPDSSRPGGEIPPLERLAGALYQQLRYTRVAVLAKVYETDAIIRRLPLVLSVRLRLGWRDPNDGTTVPVNEFTLTLGSLATDHVGYASFDLRPLRGFDVLVALARLLPDTLPPEDVRLEVRYLLLPFGESQRAIDLLAMADVGLDTIFMRLQVDRAWLVDREPDPALPAMQNPSIEDWRLSPGSFALAPARLVGNSGCEDLYPSDLSSYTFHFHQLVRVGAVVKATPERRPITAVGFGYVARFRSDWYPLGHSLGRVLYSLPLAPGEKVNLAIIDWRRQDDSFRSEATSLSEELRHDTQRDRVVGEVVRASVRERQRGHSLMAGLGASALMPLGGGIVSGSLGLGGTWRTSTGTRNVVASSIQEISDGFLQASSAFRELRSTVVTQTAQVEGGRFETRRIANFNHCHTLTILYYEVLRHYRTSTFFTGSQPVLFVDYGNLQKEKNGRWFSEASALANRMALEAALLDGRYASGFDALSRKRAGEQRLSVERTRAQESEAPVAAAWQFSRLVVIFHTGSRGHDAAVRVQLTRKDGTVVDCRQVEPPPVGDGRKLDTKDHPDYDENSIDTFVLTPDLPVRWQDLQTVQIRFEGAGFPVPPEWALDQVEIYATSSSGNTTLLAEHRHPLRLKSPENVSIPVKAPAVEQLTFAAALTDYVSEADLQAAIQLMEHLEEFGQYYRMATLLGGDPVARRLLLAETEVGEQSLGKLVDTRPIDFDGRSLVFPLSGELGDELKKIFAVESGDELDSAIVAESLVSVPTRGVFADGKQGHCNTCEVIDNTRFWDFQTSPIPGEAPPIAAVSADSRYQSPAALGATAFPANIVNIQSPTAAPDPMGLASALKVLGTPDIFRDMSGGKDLSDFLTKTVEGSQNLVKALADSIGKQELLGTIDGMDDLTPEQKTELGKAALGGSATRSEKDDASKPEKAPGGDADPNAGAPVKTPGSAAEPQRARKPERPAEEGVDGFTVRVTRPMVGPLPADLQDPVTRARLTVMPTDQTPTAPIVLDRNPSEIRMPKTAAREGSLSYNFTVTPRVVVEAMGDEGLAQLEREQVQGILPTAYDASVIFPYKLEAGRTALAVDVQYQTGGSIVDAADFSTAYSQLSTGLQGTPFIVSVSTMARDPAQPQSPRPWVFHYVMSSPAIKVDGVSVITPA